MATTNSESEVAFLECKNRLQTFVSTSNNVTELEELQYIVEQRRAALPQQPKRMRLNFPTYDRDYSANFGMDSFEVYDEGKRQETGSGPNTRFVDYIREI